MESKYTLKMESYLWSQDNSFNLIKESLCALKVESAVRFALFSISSASYSPHEEYKIESKKNSRNM